MGIRTTLSSLLSAPLAAAVSARVREVTEEVLSGRDLADPAMVRDLSRHVDHARRAIDELRADLAQLRDAVAALDDDDAPLPSVGDDLALRVAGLDARDAELGARLEATQAELSRLGDQVVALRGALGEASERAESAVARADAATLAATATSAAAPSSEVAPAAGDPDTSADRGCKVEGCDKAHRARGFCGKHYQMWKRGTLPAFISADLSVYVEEEGPRWKVDEAELAGEPAEVRRGRVYVAGKVVKAHKQGA